MAKVPTTYRDGKVIFDTPVEWPDGTRILVALVNDRVGIDESEWPKTPQGIQALLQRMDVVEPLSLEAGEQELIDKARASSRSFNADSWGKNASELEGLF